MKRRSHVWNHFKKNDNSSAVCLACSRVISYSGGSVGNLLRHFKIKHPTVDVSRPCDTYPTIVKKEHKSHKSSAASGEFDVQIFIDAVYEKKPLWNIKERNYNSDEVDELWKEVAVKTGITSLKHLHYDDDVIESAAPVTDLFATEEAAKKKWKHLRELYKKEYKKTMISGDGGYSSTWPYYHQLAFLEDEINHEFSTSSSNDNMVTEIILDENDVAANESYSSWQSTSVVREFLTPRSNNGVREIDEDTSYFNSLLPHIKKLSAIDKLKIRNEINTVVLRYISECDYTEEYTTTTVHLNE